MSDETTGQRSWLKVLQACNFHAPWRVRLLFLHSHLHILSLSAVPRDDNPLLSLANSTDATSTLILRDIRPDHIRLRLLHLTATCYRLCRVYTCLYCLESARCEKCFAARILKVGCIKRIEVIACREISSNWQEPRSKTSKQLTTRPSPA